MEDWKYNDANCFDSSNTPPILFSHSVQSRPQVIVLTDTTTQAGAKNTYDNNIENINAFDNGITFHNPSPDKLYNFTTPNTVTNNYIFEFEIIWYVLNILLLSEFKPFWPVKKIGWS